MVRNGKGKTIEVFPNPSRKGKMKTIRDNRIFEDLEKAWKKEKRRSLPTKKYWTASERDMDIFWTVLFEDNSLRNMDIPYFAGELDHVEISRKGVYFHDSGCNGRGYSFVIRREK